MKKKNLKMRTIAKAFVAFFLALCIVFPMMAFASDLHGSPAPPVTDTNAPATAGFNPQPATMADVQRYIDIFTAYMAAGDYESAFAARPHWEFMVDESLLPSGWNCQLVTGDTAFGANYYTFFVNIVPLPATIPG